MRCRRPAILGFSWVLLSLLADIAAAEPSGVCCLEDGTCMVTSEEECLQIPGGCTWLEWGSCLPNSCGPSSAACCLPGGACILRASACCHALGGVYAGADTACDPAPCATLLGVCCTFDGSCAIVTWAECLDLWETGGRCGFAVGWDSCLPNPCPQCCPETCCFPNGTCRMVWGCVGECLLLGGVPTQEWTCYPDPCAEIDVPEDDDALRVSGSWGRIKKSYR